VNGTKVNELLTANGYPPFDGDTPFTNLRYISGTLRGMKHPKACASEDRSEARTGASGSRGIKP
jgi:hypothetical protein